MNSRTRWIIIALLTSFFLIGFLGHLWPVTLVFVIRLTPGVLSVVSVGIYFLASSTKRDWHLWALFSFIFTFTIEVIGVATGRVFGVYQYTKVLGFLVLGVPLIIGFNWVMICAGAMSWVERWFGKREGRRFTQWSLVRVIVSAVLCTTFDILLEPVAKHLKYWIWESGVIPFKNYVAWFVLSLVCSTIFEVFGLLHPDLQSEEVRMRRIFFLCSFFLIEVLFFGGLNLGWAVLQAV